MPEYYGFVGFEPTTAQSKAETLPFGYKIQP